MNIEWVDINLPWSVSYSSEDAFQSPDLSKKQQEVFGDSLKEWDEKLRKEFYKLCDLLDEIIDSITDDVSNAELDKIESDFWESHKNDPCVVAKKFYDEIQQKINEWWLEQPEWIEYERKKKEFFGNSFTGQGLAKPGTLIELENGSIELIGSINRSAGVCDDCVGFSSNTVIKRYAVVFPFEEMRRHE